MMSSSIKGSCRLCSKIFTHYEGRYSPWALLCSSYSGVRHTVVRIILERSAQAGCKLCRLLFVTVLEADQKKALVEDDENSTGRSGEAAADDQENDEVHFQFSFEKRYENNTKVVKPVLLVSRLDSVFSRPLEFDVGTLDGAPNTSSACLQSRFADEPGQAIPWVRNKKSKRHTSSPFKMRVYAFPCQSASRRPTEVHGLSSR